MVLFGYLHLLPIGKYKVLYHQYLLLWQYLSLHQDSLSSTPDDPKSLATGSLSVTVTLTDGDGDKFTSSAADISAQISFEDDGPSVAIAAAGAATVGLDETATTSTTA